MLRVYNQCVIEGFEIRKLVDFVLFRTLQV